MSAPDFKPGDTVRVLPGNGLVSGLTGTVTRLSAYIHVDLPGHGVAHLFTASELELLVPSRQAIAGVVVDALYPSGDTHGEDPMTWPAEVWAVADALIAEGYAKTATEAQA